MFSGEVFLRRLSWNKVWKLSKQGDGVKVTSIAWRPDSVVLAVGYSSGQVVLVDVETGETVHSFNPCNEAITTLTWENNNSSLNDETINFLQSKLLPQPSKINSSKLAGNSNEGDKVVKHEDVLSLLWIGLKNGVVYGYAFGLFPCCLLRLSQLAGGGEMIGDVLNICPNYDHSQLTVLAKLRTGRPEVLLISVETHLMSHCLKELYVLGVLYRQITGLIECLASAQKSLHEAWGKSFSNEKYICNFINHPFVILEDALVDLESKMVHYDGESSLSVDLMELLMFGHAGIKLEKFLVTELTDKGLKRVGQVNQI